MIKKINQYLLTHYPLLWNTRAVWVLIVNLILYLIYFIAGYNSIHIKEIHSYSSDWEVGGSGLYMFSVLCSLLVLILWLVYFLRNNAFKNFYPIGRQHLAKEWLLILLIVFTSLIYFEAFNLGVRKKVRTITSTAQLAQEVKIINLAMGFVPMEKSPYYILNNCAGKKERKEDSYVELNYPDTNESRYYNSSDSMHQQSRRLPDALNYRNYCKEVFSTDVYTGITNAEALAAQRIDWINAHRTDSITRVLDEFTAICDRYDIPYRLNIPSLVTAVFAKPYNTISILVSDSEYDYSSSPTTVNTYYLDKHNLQNALEFINSCFPSTLSNNKHRDVLLFESYFAIIFSILLLCYRRFSRRAFLISILGVLVWSIIVGLIGIAVDGSEKVMLLLLLTLCLSFLLLAISLLRMQVFRTLTGALLSWHVYLVPFMVFSVIGLMDVYYTNTYSYILSETDRANLYPIRYWITQHQKEIVIANLLLVILYLAFVFNPLAKRWSTMPDE